MAKYRIKWRNILFNLPLVVLIIVQLKDSWPRLKTAAMTCITDDPQIADFIANVDQLFRIFARRR